MIRQSNLKFWVLWLVVTITIVEFLAVRTFSDDADKLALMPGKLTDGHHQIAEKCDVCHTENFSSKDDLQKACLECHGEFRKKKPIDSHPKSKFKDPRNAATLENIDALYCITCHVEHKAEITNTTGLTQPEDFCIHCHQDIAEERPSHEGMGFETYNSAGCHNFHNNQALYTDFLVKHLHEPDLLEKTTVPKREFGQILDQLAEYPRDRFPVTALTHSDAETPPGTSKQHAIHQDWLETAHAASGVNCTACHVVPEAQGGTGEWTDQPGSAGCGQCHDVESDHFQQGKHGMRLRAGLTPMTPDKARLPMKPEAAAQELTCVTCHSAHRFDVTEAAVESCLSCHDDQHSLAYKQSKHYDAWIQEQTGTLPEGSGVSCATCHMPRMNMDVSDWMARVVVQHNQNATLRPNEKMIRPACLHCHGLEFSINSLADPKLIENNFQGHPTFRTESMDLAEKDSQR